MEIVVIIINLILSFVSIVGFLPPYGIIIAIIYTIISIFRIYSLKNDEEAYLRFVNRHLIPTDDGKHYGNEKTMLISAACLAGGMKIGTVLALTVKLGVVALIAAFIFVIVGKKSDIAFWGAWMAAKVIYWIYEKINGIYDFIVRLIVKIEFKILKIDIKDNK